jgi:adenosylcobinamide-phosphate synthase
MAAQVDGLIHPMMPSFWLLLREAGAGMTGLLAPRFVLWAAIGLALDAVIGDPVFRLHPVRLLGGWLALLENALFKLGWNGYGGGIALFFLLAATSIPACLVFLALALAIHPLAFDAAAGLIVWTCVALRDLMAHSSRVRRGIEQRDLGAARRHIGMLVGRDVDRMDLGACGRAAVESLAENLVDGVLSPLAFALVLGPMGAVLYKIASTMDSMVGYKNARYLKFGWCGARLDDLLNFPVARWAFLLIAGAAGIVRGCDAQKAWRIGLRDHTLVPGPNSGWPEATMAGALSMRLAGPIYKDGVMTSDLWLGDPADPPGAGPADIRHCHRILVLATLATFLLGWALSAL